MKMYQKIFLVILISVVIVSYFGCQKNKPEEAEIQALIDSRVAEKVAHFRKKRILNCRERVLKRASELADSIIISRAKSTTIIDNTTRPIPPERPVRPLIRQPVDTTPVRPFFQEKIDTGQ